VRSLHNIIEQNISASLHSKTTEHQCILRTNRRSLWELRHNINFLFNHPTKRGGRANLGSFEIVERVSHRHTYPGRLQTLLKQRSMCCLSFEKDTLLLPSTVLLVEMCRTWKVSIADLELCTRPPCPIHPSKTH